MKRGTAGCKTGTGAMWHNAGKHIYKSCPEVLDWCVVPDPVERAAVESLSGLPKVGSCSKLERCTTLFTE
jgi:hypothetical protein